MRKSVLYSVGIVGILLLGVSVNWIFADREKKLQVAEKNPLRADGKSLVVRGILSWDLGRWTLKDQSPFFSGHLFILLENVFLEEILQKQDQQPNVPLWIRGRYHFFQGRSFLLPTHLHSREEIIFPEKS